MEVYMRGFIQGKFKVIVTVEGSQLVGTLFNSDVEVGKCYSSKSHFHCALKGFAYLKTMNDMPTNFNIN